MRRRTSMGDPLDSALDRNIDSKYDVIKAVYDELGSIEDIGTAIEDGTLDDILAILGMTVATGPEGSSATWDGITLTVPRGDTGAQGDKGDAGFDGLTPNYEFIYNPVSGVLSYELVSYTDINTNTVSDLPVFVDPAEVVEDIETEEEW